MSLGHLILFGIFVWLGASVIATGLQELFLRLAAYWAEWRRVRALEDEEGP